MKPNLFIVGAAKSGTSTLHSILDTHPDIFMSLVKEPHFFAKEINQGAFHPDFRKVNLFDEETYFSQDILMPLHSAIIQDEKHYLELFRSASTQKYRGEASPSYLFSKSAPQEIANYCKEPKILIILRDPVERLVSHYQMDIMTGLQKEKNIYEGVMRDFEQKEKGWGISHLYIELSQYKDQVQQYLKIFGPSRVLLLDFALLKAKPEKLFEQIAIFLNIPNDFDLDDTPRNETIMPNNTFVRNLLNIWQKVKFFELGTNLKKRLLNIFFSRPEIVIPEVFYDEMQQLLGEDVEYYRMLFKAKG